MEEPLYFPSDGFRLFGVLHLQEGARPPSSESRVTGHASRIGFVFCAPFGEEQKQAYRVYVEMARRLEGLGFPSLRFDYRGTGDSHGAFAEFSLAGALRDIQAAAAFLSQRTGVARVGLIGLRLGASLALKSVECGVRSAECQEPEEAGSGGTRHAARVTPLPSSLVPRPSLLVLWQPIVDGALFYRLNIRRMLVRQMMTHGKATGERDTGSAETIDLDGFLASRAMCEEIKALRISDFGLRIADFPPTLLVQFAPTTEPTAEVRPLVERLGPKGSFLSFVMEPFWDRLGYIDCGAAIEATVAWVVGRAGPRGG
ncbi:MAG: hypothetical protein FJ291_09320 [Planctomycetes bacterium]|nr:hypothetical protein [Planctomycetota bacterium]